MLLQRSDQDGAATKAATTAGAPHARLMLAHACAAMTSLDPAVRRDAVSACALVLAHLPPARVAPHARALLDAFAALLKAAPPPTVYATAASAASAASAAAGKPNGGGGPQKQPACKRQKVRLEILRGALDVLSALRFTHALRRRRGGGGDPHAGASAHGGGGNDDDTAATLALALELDVDSLSLEAHVSAALQPRRAGLVCL